MTVIRAFKCACVFLAFAFEMLQIGETIAFPSQINPPHLSTSKNEHPPTSPPYTSNKRDDENVNEKKFLYRKCCDGGQVFHVNTQVAGNNRCINYTISTSHPSSTLGENSQQLSFLKEDQLPPHYTITDVKIDPGFQRSCTFSSEIFDKLDPTEHPEERFYLLASGQLVVPHRFWLLQPEDYCIEDVYYDEKPKAKKMAYICINGKFPPAAIDDKGKLKFDFIQSTLPYELSKMAGQMVVRKCCNMNQILEEHEEGTFCVNNQGYSTPFLDDLKKTAKDNPIFFRNAMLQNCRNIKKTSHFRLLSGSLQVRPNAESDWNKKLISTDNYCLENFVRIDYGGLPETIMMASFCSDEEIDVPDLFPFTYYGPVLELNYEDSKELIETPKCCMHGYVVDEETKSCQPSHLIDSEWTISNALNSYLLATNNISSILVPNAPVACGYADSHSLLPEGSTSLVKTKLEYETESNLSISVKFYSKNYWDYELKPRSFCVDMSRYSSKNHIVYIPQVYICGTSTSVLGHYPVLLSISAIALLATFIIYFFVPASGAAKLVTSFGGAKKRKAPSMAMMLTGRILLCHVFTLALTFILFAVGQSGRVSVNTPSCVALGYITYGVSIASFSWLAVYCFDYCRIFSGSFKVSNDILFLPYSAFGWGIPILAVTAVAVVQFHSADLGIPSTSNPNMGLPRCWFPADGNSAMIFFYIPVSVLILLNIASFLTLILNPNLMKCWKKKQQITVRSNRNAPKISDEQQDLKMAIKLFFITGVPWMFEIAAWLSTHLTGATFLTNNSQYFFEISNLLNSLRGVVIFFIFVVLQRDVRRFLLQKIFKKKDSPKDIRDQEATNNQTETLTTAVNTEN